jgi:predicted dehydrogenase
MSRHTVRIVVNGVTGRMGYRQHLLRSLLAIRAAGGVPLADGTSIWPELVLVGRNPTKLAELAERHDLPDWTTDLDAALARDDVHVYFDAQLTQAREKAIRAAIAAGKHIYTEKPLADTAATRWSWPRPPARPASATAWCRTSCSCPGCASSSA